MWPASLLCASSQACFGFSKSFLLLMESGRRGNGQRKKAKYAKRRTLPKGVKIKEKRQRDENRLRNRRADSQQK